MSEAINSESNQPKILFIDDERNVLSALQRQLRKDFSVVTALGFDEAIKAVAADGPFAVAVCDMRMPGHDGIETLSAIKSRSPDTVRVMLTGNADQETAAAAINRGHIFRFLTKPCADDVLRGTLNDALRQHQLITAEKSVLQQTLTGSVKMLVDVLSLAAPEAFERATRARQWVKPLAEQLGIAQRWDIELATMLAPIGYAAVPEEVCAKERKRLSLTGSERDMLARVPQTGQKLLSHIPRLKNVADWVGSQKAIDEVHPLGARIVAFLTALAAETAHDVPTAADIQRLKGTAFGADVLDAAEKIWGHHEAAVENLPSAGSRVRSSLSALQPNDYLLEPIMFKSGKLLLSKGSRLSAIQLERLRNLRTMEAINEPIEVLRSGLLH